MNSRTLTLLILVALSGFWFACAQTAGRDLLARVVPVLPQRFTDMKIMLEGAEIVKHQGFSNFWETIDQSKLDYNYPRSWAALGMFGLGLDALTWMALLGLLAFFATAWIVLGLLDGRSDGKNLLVLLLFFSPAVLLAIERANTDLLIFGGVGLLLGLVARAKWMGRGWLLLAGFLALVGLKFYPVLLFPLLWLMLNTTQRWALVVGVSVCLAWLIPDLIEVATRTHQGGPAAYGVTVFKLYVREGGNNFLGALLGRGLNFQRLSQVIGIASYAAALGVLLFHSRIVRQLGALAEQICPVDPSAPVDRFWFSGSLIYVGTFLLGANFDYRLIFLLLTVPWYLRHPGKLCWIHVTLLVVSMWAWYLPRDIFLVRLVAYAAQFLIYVEVACLLLARWLRPWGEIAVQSLRPRASSGASPVSFPSI